MHLCKRLAGCLLALILVATLTPAASARQLYSYILNAGCAEEIGVMLDAISEQTFSVTNAADVRSYIEHFLYRSSFSAINGGRFPYTNAQGYWAGKAVSDGTYYQVVSATGCFAYCKFVSQAIYGTAGERRDLGESAGRITADGLKNFLKLYAQAGEHIRIDSKHSVTFVSGNEEGFYYLDYAGDQNPRIYLRYSTYANFAAYCNSLCKKVWIYEADHAENAEIPAEPESYQPADWFADHALAAEELGLTQSGNTLAYDGGLTLAETATLVARVHSLITEGGTELQTQGGQTWYDPYVDYLKENQILDSDLDYSGMTTRDQFVSLLYAAVPADMELESLNPPVTFTDAAGISDPQAVEALCQAGVLTGVQEPDGVYFYPDNLITRGEAIVLITRLVLSEYRVSVN
ncbi:MAG: S-layer homology domain-containing protein [Oscillospiraceae bacterium]